MANASRQGLGFGGFGAAGRFAGRRTAGGGLATGWPRRYLQWRDRLRNQGGVCRELLGLQHVHAHCLHHRDCCQIGLGIGDFFCAQTPNADRGGGSTGLGLINSVDRIANAYWQVRFPMTDSVCFA